MSTRNFCFTPNAFEQYSDWIITNKLVLRKIKELLLHISRTPFEGKGKPEPLKHQLQGYWSRRISSEHRLVYMIDGNKDVIIISCKGHY